MPCTKISNDAHLLLNIVSSAFHLDGENSCSGEKSNGMALDIGIFRKKWKTYRGVPLFSFLPLYSENHCTTILLFRTITEHAPR